MSMTATICEVCHTAQASWTVKPQFDPPSSACGPCAARTKREDKRAELTPLISRPGTVIAVEQPDLFGGEPERYEVPAHVSGSSTSLGAAQKIAGKAGTLRAKVLESIRLDGPASDEELQERLAMDPSTQRPRRVELCNADLLHKVGETKTRSGRSATVWGLTERGKR